MNAPITTATLLVCSRCGRVSHLEGTVQPQAVLLEACSHPGRHVGEPASSARHSFGPVVVMVPWA